MNAALLAVALLAGAAERQVLSVDASASTVRYHVTHKLHRVDGTSSRVEGKAVVEPDGRVLAMVRIPVASFDSGDANRDSHMREALEEGRYPWVVLKGVTNVPVPLAAGQRLTLKLQGELDLHGVKHPVEVPLVVALGREGSAQVQGKLEVSLEAYRIERPSLLFVKLEDVCAVDFDLSLRRSP
jgi:polyisoprenoid-binding protein YceI